MIYTLCIPGWLPARLNKLLDCHWGQRARLKAADREQIGRAVRAYEIPTARCKRKVDVLLVLPKGVRTGDRDGWQKSLLDALKLAGALRDDSPNWCEWAPPRFARGEQAETFITLEDLS